ncbi:MAG: DUF5723 family protein, partial [Prevotellaceae bacterium]|nr:DUF5723 family protein [Prevotellaceae bacterium]
MKKIYLAIIIIACAINTNAQQINTQYFLENSPVRHYWNPSFQPQSKVYISLPVLGYLQVGLSNNSVGLNNLFTNNLNGQTITFLHPDGNKQQFYDALSNTADGFLDLRVNLLGLGFRTGKTGYFNFTMSVRVDGTGAMPKDMFKLLLYGTPEANGYNDFDFKSLGINGTAYLETALGYSKKFSDKLTIGAKLKFLTGIANISTDNDALTLKAGMDDWLLQGNGKVRIASPLLVKTGATISDLSLSAPDKVVDWIMPAGYGGGIDFGFSYKPVEALTLSAAINDLGMLMWTKNATTINYGIDYKFEGMGKVSGGDLSMSELADSVIDAIKAAGSTDTKTEKYKSYTSPKLNVGAEYAFLKNKLSIGVLSSTMFQGGEVFEQVVLSGNIRPARWFNTSVSYAVLPGKSQNIGAALGLRTGFIHWLISADYIGLEYGKYKGIPVPYKTKGFNLGLGFNLVFGNKIDKDNNKAKDKDNNKDKSKAAVLPKDLTADTINVIDTIDTIDVIEAVEAVEAIDTIEIIDVIEAVETIEAIDTIEIIDVIEDVIINATDTINSLVDTPKDSVLPNSIQCPDTPPEAFGYTDENGCPK